MEPYEYPKKSGIKISLKDNRTNGTNYGVSFIVTVPAKITGQGRKRKQFKEQSSAETWADSQWRGYSKQGEVYFNSTTEERNDFASIMPKLRKSGISLKEAVEFALPRLKPAGGDRTFALVVEELRSSKKAMLERGTLREHSERAFRIRSEKIVDAFGQTLIRDLTLEEVRTWLESLDLAPRTLKNQLNCLSEALRYSVARKYVVENILDGLTTGDSSKVSWSPLHESAHLE